MLMNCYSLSFSIYFAVIIFHLQFHRGGFYIFSYFRNGFFLWFILSGTFCVVQCEPINPCESNPCGANAICNERNGVGSCKCLPNYFGDPYLGCRPECVQNGDCPFEKSCINLRCENPCIGVCDNNNAECFVVNHLPMCHCKSGFTGNPQFGCHQLPTNGKFKFKSRHRLIFLLKFVFFLFAARSSLN